MTTPRQQHAGLLARVRMGESSAFSELLQMHDAAMRGLVVKLLGPDRHRMDDVLQDAYLKAFRSIGTFRGDAAFGTWLHRVVRNCCMDEMRRAGRRPVPTLPQERASEDIGVEEQLSRSDTVLRALALLSPDQRATVVLIDGEGLTTREAADSLGVAEGTIASRLSRARLTLRTHLAGEL